MRVKCIGNKGSDLPEKYLESGNTKEAKFPVKLGEIYTVYGICFAKIGTVHYFCKGSYENLPSWYPAELFVIEDNIFPIEWYFNYINYKEDDPILAVWGYKEFALDINHRRGLIEREEKDIEIFLQRKKEIDEYCSFNAE